MGYPKRHLAAPLEHLALAGFVDRWMPANSYRYRLTPAARAFMYGPRHSHADIDWINWPRRYRLLAFAENANAALTSTGGLVAATALLKQADAEFTPEGIAPLEAMSSAEWSLDQAARIRSWINSASSHLVTEQV